MRLNFDFSSTEVSELLHYLTCRAAESCKDCIYVPDSLYTLIGSLTVSRHEDFQESDQD